MSRRLIAAAFLGLALTACADAPAAGPASDDPLAVLRQASERTLEAGSARMTFVFEVDAAGRTQAMDGSAEIRFGDGDPASLQARMTLRFPDVGSAMPAGRMEIILDRGPVIYVSADLFASLFPVETPWIKLDPTALGEGWPGMTGFTGGRTDPSSSFGFLFGAIDVEDLGEEIVDGAPATRYRATIDLEEALRQIPQARRAALQEAIRSLREQAGGAVPELPMDVWIADGLLKRVVFELSMDGVEGADGPASFSATITLSDVGADLAIDPPPSDLVTDLSELAGALGDASEPSPVA